MRFQNIRDSKLPIFSTENSSAAQTVVRDGTPTAEAIQTWLVAKLAEKLSIDPDEIEVHEQIASYGVDSMTALTLSGDLEDWLGLRLSPTLAWDYPTIAALAEQLAQEVKSAEPILQGGPRNTQLKREGERAAAGLSLAELDQLSEAQVEALLEEMLALESNR